MVALVVRAHTNITIMTDLIITEKFETDLKTLLTDTIRKDYLLFVYFCLIYQVMMINMDDMYQ